MATIQKRVQADGSPSYRVLIRKQGFRPRTATFRTKKEADAWAKKVEGELVGMRYDPTLVAGKHALADLIDQYLKHHNFAKGHDQRRRLAWWRKELGHVKLAELTAPAIRNKRDEYRDGCAIRGGKKPKPTEKRRAPATVNRLHTALSAALTWGVDHLGWLEQNPARLVKRMAESNTETRFLTTEEIDTLRDACNAQPWGRLWLLVIMGIITGARQGELLSLRWKQVSWHEGRRLATALLGRTKNGEPRVLSIVGEAYDELQKAHARDSSDELTSNDWKDLLVFRSPTKPKQHFVGFTNQWKAAREAAGLWHPGDKDKHVKFHTTRHTAASHMVQNGIDLYTVQKILGHKTPHVTQRYSHLQVEHQIEAVESVWAKKEPNDSAS